MAPKKRKAGLPAGAVGHPKKVRIENSHSVSGEDSNDVTTTALPDRPKRASLGTPQYTFTRPKLTAPQKAEDEHASNIAPVKRGRGRPPTTSAGEKLEIQVPTPKKAGPATKAAQPATKAEQKSQQTARSATRTASKQAALNEVTIAAASKHAVPTKAAASAPGRRGRQKGTKVVDGKVVFLAESDVNGADEEQLDYQGEPGQEEEEANDDRQYWLMKAEPESRIEKGVDVKFSIDDLMGATEPEPWDGVRNPTARNNMRAMRKGDLAFFYHSNCQVPGIAGVMRIVEEHSVDESAFNPQHPYYDSKSDREKPKWEVVHVAFVKKFDQFLGLKEMKTYALKGGVLENMQTLRQSRLSVTSVSPKEWKFILHLADEEDLLTLETEDETTEGEERLNESDPEEEPPVGDDIE